MGAKIQVPKFTRARLTPPELLCSHLLHDNVAESLRASDGVQFMLNTLRRGDRRFGEFVAGVSEDWRLFWHNHKKAVALIIAPEKITNWNRRGKNLFPWLLGDLLNAMRTGKSKRWFKADETPKKGCPKRMRVAMRVFRRMCALRLESYKTPELSRRLAELREQLLDAMVQHPAARPALAYLLFAWTPCVIHFGMMPGQLLRRARSGRDFDALLNLLRLDKFAASDKRVLRLVQGELYSGNEERARLVREAMRGRLPAASEFMVKTRIAGLSRRLVPNTRLINTQSIRRVADGVVRASSGGRLLSDRSLGISNDRFTKEVYRASILYRAISRKPNEAGQKT